MLRAFLTRLGFAAAAGLVCSGAFVAPASAAGDAVVTGTLIDSAGQPAPTAFVIVENDATGESEYLYTDENGAYSASVPAGTYRVSFSFSSLTQWAHQKITRDEADTFAVGSGETVRVDDRLLPTGSVGGRLTRSDGAPVVGTQLTLYRDGAPFIYAYSDDDGRYRFDAVLPGEYKLSFRGSTFEQYVPGATDLAGGRSFAVAVGEHTTVDDVLLDPPTLVVKATDSVTGAAVTDFCVYAWDYLGGPVCSDDAGVATVTGLPPTSLTFDVETSAVSFYLSKSSVPATLAAGRTTTVTVPLVQGGRVAIAATDHATGQVVEDACFTLKMIGRPEPLGGGCTGNTGTGSTYAPVAAGTYEVFVQAPGTYGHQWVGRSGGTGDQQAAARIVVRPGRTARAPAVLLDQAGTITGVVTGADGAPLARANVNYRAVASYGSGEPEGVFTDAAGRYSIGKLGPYSWPLLFSADGYPDQWSGHTGNRFAASAIPVVAGGSSSFDMALTRTSKLRGTITPAVDEVRLLAFNAVTGDLVGVFHGYDVGNKVGAYEILLAGGQQVKLQWDVYSGADEQTWYVNATDIAAATKVGIPAAGARRLNLAHHS